MLRRGAHARVWTWTLLKNLRIQGPHTIFYEPTQKTKAFGRDISFQGKPLKWSNWAWRCILCTKKSIRIQNAVSTRSLNKSLQYKIIIFTFACVKRSRWMNLLYCLNITPPLLLLSRSKTRISPRFISGRNISISVYITSNPRTAIPNWRKVQTSVNTPIKIAKQGNYPGY